MVDAYFNFHKLTGPTRQNLSDTFHRMAELLPANDAHESARLQFCILDSGQRRSGP